MVAKRIGTLFVVCFVGLASGAMAATIGERVDIAQQRIEHGMRSGALTRDETYRLRDELNRVKRDEARARADGRLDRREREQLNQELTRLERHIAKFKNNDMQRRDRR